MIALTDMAHTDPQTYQSGRTTIAACKPELLKRLALLCQRTRKSSILYQTVYFLLNQTISCLAKVSNRESDCLNILLTQQKSRHKAQMDLLSLVSRMPQCPVVAVCLHKQTWKSVSEGPLVSFQRAGFKKQ